MRQELKTGNIGADDSNSNSQERIQTLQVKEDDAEYLNATYENYSRTESPEFAKQE